MSKLEDKKGSRLQFLLPEKCEMTELAFSKCSVALITDKSPIFTLVTDNCKIVNERMNHLFDGEYY